MNIKESFKKEECCGCGACKNICPKNAITLKSDDKGFWYPEIDYNLCIECGLCSKTCDFKNPNLEKNITTKSYAVKHNDEKEISTSRSGAFFMALCDYVLDRDGVVFGCEMDGVKSAIHKLENTKEGINKFKGSKYVQSNTLNTFRECKEQLKSDKYVLYSGTACQVHALLIYLEVSNVKTDKLLTCDIVCHGVPSPKFWEYYIEYNEKKTGHKITTVDFRDKSQHGWRAHIESFVTDDGIKHYSKAWTDAFYSHLIMRDSCYNCKYTRTDRRTDFTIADYWGIERNAPEFDDNKGVSLVMVRGKKSLDIFDNLNINFIETNLANSLQPQLKHPISKSSLYNWFWKKHEKNDIKAMKYLLFPTNIEKYYFKVRKKLSFAIKK